jgi:hypothetical protein
MWHHTGNFLSSAQNEVYLISGRVVAIFTNSIMPKLHFFQICNSCYETLLGTQGCNLAFSLPSTEYTSLLCVIQICRCWVVSCVTVTWNDSIIKLLHWSQHFKYSFKIYSNMQLHDRSNFLSYNYTNFLWTEWEMRKSHWMYCFHTHFTILYMEKDIMYTFITFTLPIHFKGLFTNTWIFLVKLSPAAFVLLCIRNCGDCHWSCAVITYLLTDITNFLKQWQS